jgi:small-conductance mechanosensitive channel
MTIEYSYQTERPTVLVPTKAELRAAKATGRTLTGELLHEMRSGNSAAPATRPHLTAHEALAAAKRNKAARAKQTTEPALAELQQKLKRATAKIQASDDADLRAKLARAQARKV